MTGYRQLRQGKDRAEVRRSCADKQLPMHHQAQVVFSTGSGRSSTISLNMRASLRLLATAQKAGTSAYLTPLAPTGLTGVLTHPNPRPNLLYLYKATLDKLSSFPEHSVYKQSVEALTKHRLAIVEKQVPPGFDEWHARNSNKGTDYSTVADSQQYLHDKTNEKKDEREIEWDDTIGQERTEGPRAADNENNTNQALEFGAGRSASDEHQPLHAIVEEPPLTRDQVTEIENEIGAGLIEEIVVVAERELALVAKMQEAAVWEELAEKPVEGQWAYNERGTHTGTT